MLTALHSLLLLINLQRVHSVSLGSKGFEANLGVGKCRHQRRTNALYKSHQLKMLRQRDLFSKLHKISCKNYRYMNGSLSLLAPDYYILKEHVKPLYALRPDLVWWLYMLTDSSLPVFLTAHAHLPSTSCPMHISPYQEYEVATNRMILLDYLRNIRAWKSSSERWYCLSVYWLYYLHLDRVAPN